MYLCIKYIYIYKYTLLETQLLASLVVVVKPRCYPSPRDDQTQRLRSQGIQRRRAKLPPSLLQCIQLGAQNVRHAGLGTCRVHGVNRYFTSKNCELMRFHGI